MTQLKKLVEAIDAQVLKGDFIGAFEKFAADNCVTLSNPQDATHSKAQKLEALKWFFHNIASVDHIERIGVKVGEQVTDSQFVFRFTNRLGEPLEYREVIRRTWQNGLMQEEQYLIGAELDLSEPAPAKAQKAAKTTAKVEKPAAPKAEKPVAAAKTVKTAAPKAEKPAVAKTEKPVVAAKAVKTAATPKAEKPAAAKKPAAKTKTPKV